MKIQRLFSTLCVTLLLVLAGCGGSPSDSDNNGEDPPDNSETEDTTPPASPDGLDGNSGDEMVELSWNANNEDDLGGYNVYRSENSFTTSSGMDPVNGSPVSGTEFTDEGVQNGTTYYYRLTAVDESDNKSDLSASEIEITPFPNPPDRL